MSTVIGMQPSHGVGDGPEPSAVAPTAAHIHVHPVADAATTSPDAVRWDAYVDGHGAASVYHRWAWRAVIREAFGHPTDYLVAETDGRIRGVFPLCHMNSRLFGTYAVSLPFFTYGGPLADDPETEAALLSAAIDRIQETAATHLEVRACHPPPSGAHGDLPVRDDKIALVLPLPDDPDTLWDGFKAKLRSQVRRPRKAGMTAEVGGIELLDAFYTVFVRNMRDLGTPVYSRNLFAQVLGHWPESRIIIVRHQGLPVGAALVVGYQGRLEIPWASTNRDFNAQSPNMLLYWTVLEWACQNGYSSFDFGRSTEGAGTDRFKRQWGAEPQPLYWWYWLRDGGEPPRINPDNPRYRLAIRAWQKLPLWVTRYIGPAIVKHLP